MRSNYLTLLGNSGRRQGPNYDNANLDVVADQEG